MLEGKMRGEMCGGGGWLWMVGDVVCEGGVGGGVREGWER